MSVVAQNLYNKVLASFDSLTEDGVPVAAEDNIDLQEKFLVFADSSQKQLAKQSKVTKQVELTSKPPENRLGNESNFDIVDFEGEDQFYPSEQGIDNVQGYSIEVDGDCTITYQEQVSGTWTDLTVLTPTGLTEMTTYKGVLTVSDTTNPVRIKISGTTHFKHMNRALWKFLYAADKVPEYAPWVKYDLPTDFNTMDMVVEEFPQRKYSNLAIYKVENYKDFYYDFTYEGKIRITYKPIPPTITALTDIIEIDDTLAETIVNDVVAKIAFYENKDLINFSENRRIEGKQEAATDKPTSPSIMIDSYGGGEW